MSPNVSDVDEGIDDSDLADSLAAVAENDNEDVFHAHPGTRSLTESSEATPVPSSVAYTDDSILDVIQLPTSAGNREWNGVPTYLYLLQS
ncbi:unnamed protein product [Strongylus vulgaris]|uniref:Uncharacterized protein n=1 Tax=Strongylus vulgaris TaxID=40348 RepID=A0A3P7KZQ0_STRVU|nr:unnamed protein product [Strongylus vulgaris]